MALTSTANVSRARPPARKSALKEPAAWRAGLEQARLGRWDAAARSLAQAAALMTGDVDVWVLLANARRRCGDLPGAAAAAQRALDLDPGHETAMALCWRSLQAAGRGHEAQQVLRAAPLQALDAAGWAERADAELRAAQPVAAIHTCLHALRHRMTDGTLHYRLGLAFEDLGRKADAVECLRTALLLNLGPLETGVRDMLVFHERDLCDWSSGQSAARVLCESMTRLGPDAAVRTNPFAHATLSDDPSVVLQAARSNARFFARGVVPLPARAPARRERLRVGYVSADFHHHATVMLMAQMLECHDRRRFDIHLYDHGRDDGSPERARVQAAASVFRSVGELGDREFAQRIRDDGIDILVDLKGYTRGARPGVFAHRPAPVQVAYLGYPGTSGSTAIDYLVGDPFVTPIEHAHGYTEKIAQLPGSYQCNDGTRALPTPPARAAVGLPEPALVLCAFNQAYKISPEVFDVWCRLLQQLPEAVLWLLEGQPEAVAALTREAAARGIDPVRLIFAPKVEHRAHLDRSACADLFLDTWPCNGHTTASDMLWAGAPVVTCAGRTFASRVAGSLLRAIGVPELVCRDPAEYEELIINLARDSQRLAGLRWRVRQARHQSETFNGAAAAKHLEALFERMWSRALAGLPPEHLEAEIA